MRRVPMPLRRFLILSHRWLGIPLSLLFVVWFASGIVMMYAGGMPQLSAEQRLERRAPLRLSDVRLTPSEAAESAGLAGRAAAPTLLSVLGRPAYRFGGGTTVFADDGALLEPLDPEQSRVVAAGFLDVADDLVEYERTVTEPDQWTLTQARELPLHKFDVRDGAGTEVYVSPWTAEVAMMTTRGSRALAWIGTIPHWFYFTPLRVDQPLWYWTIVWTSALGCVLVVLGLALGVTQFRPSKPFRLSASIRYRRWMRWHYLLGVVFGVFTLTWVFSGLLSVEPFAWTRAEGFRLQRDALSGGPLELARYGALDERAWAGVLDGRTPKEIELVRIQDEPYYVVRYTAVDDVAAQTSRRERLHQPYVVGGRSEPGQLLVAADGLTARTEPFTTSSILSRIGSALPQDINVVDHALLTEYDSYYYSRGGEAPLPVLRVRLDDPLETWIYVDPQMSRVLGQVHRLARVERWLFNGLHSLDFAFWYDKRPLWDIGMIILSLGGLIASAIGLVFGFRRLFRIR